MRLASLLVIVFLPFVSRIEDEAPVAPRPGDRGAEVVSRGDVVWISAGWLTRGSDEDGVRRAISLCLEELRDGQDEELCSAQLFLVETPRQRVWISRFGIDRTEVTQSAWRRCMQAGACAPPRVSDADARLAHPDHPVTGVTHRDALAYCTWVGGRLPTESEWEVAARGRAGRTFPWGDQWNPRLASHGRLRETDTTDGYALAAPVGSYPSAASPFGLLDVAGNVWEWTSDLFVPEAYLLGERVDPRGGDSGGQRVIRGGSYRVGPALLRTAFRIGIAEGSAAPDVGFRCAYTP